MALVFEPSSPADLDAITGLMRQAFDAPANAPFLDRRLLEWKYFAAGPEWNGSRSYLLRKADAVYAHCAVWPVTRQARGICLVDWVSGKQLPGAGLMLLKKILTLTSFALVAGGSDDTLAVIPRIGFVPCGEAKVMARVIRPWRQHRTRPAEEWKHGVARLARNTVWSFGAPAPPPGWSADPVEGFDDGTAFGERTPAFLNHWLACPAAPVSGYVLRRRGEPAGHFLLTRVDGQTRIADLRAADAQLDAAYSTAARVAASFPDTCEIVAFASTAAVEKALAAAGFRARGCRTLFICPPDAAPGIAPLVWNYADDDTAYICDPCHPFVT